MTDYAGTFERYFREYSDNGLDRRRTISYQFRAWRYYRCRKTISPQGRWYANLYLHNGKIYIESTECQGSTVRIILPKEKEQFKNFTISNDS